jgi:hypothetical protein
MGEDGYVMRGSGDSWYQIPSTVDVLRTLYSAWGATESEVYFVGLVDDGKTETVYDTLNDTTIDTSILVIGDKPVLTKWDGGVFIEEELDDELVWGLYDIWGSAADDIYAVGYNGNVLHYDGVEWTVEFAGGTSPVFLNSIWGTSADNIYTSGTDGTLLHFNGTEWSVVRTPTGDDLWDVWGLNDSTIYPLLHLGNRRTQLVRRWLGRCHSQL